MTPEEFLEKNGFKDYGFHTIFNATIFQKEIQTEERYKCDQNEEIVITCARYGHQQNGNTPPVSPSAEISIVHEKGGLWFKVMAYSIDWDDLPTVYDAIERKLIAAWKAIVDV